MSRPFRHDSRTTAKDFGAEDFAARDSGARDSARRCEVHMTWDRYKPRAASHGSGPPATRHRPPAPLRAGRPAPRTGPLAAPRSPRRQPPRLSHAACHLKAAGQLGRQRQRQHQPPLPRAPRTSPSGYVCPATPAEAQVVTATHATRAQDRTQPHRCPPCRAWGRGGQNPGARREIDPPSASNPPRSPHPIPRERKGQRL